MIQILRAIFGAIVCGDFLIAGLIWMFAASRRNPNPPERPQEVPDETET